VDGADWEEARALLIAVACSGLLIAAFVIRSGRDPFRTWWHFLPVAAPVVAVGAALAGPRTSQGVAIMVGFTLVGAAVVFGLAASGAHGEDQGLWPIGMVLVSACMATLAGSGALVGMAVRGSHRERT
jgi:hypothetical protein